MAETLLAEVVGIDKDAKIVHTRDGEQIAYDSLIVATGSVYNYFGHEEQWKGFAPSLKTLADSADIRERILDAFERAEKEPDEEKIPSLITFRAGRRWGRQGAKWREQSPRWRTPA